jgi:hypothetical protein
MGARKYTDADLAHAVSASRTMREILIALGLAPYGGNYETVRKADRRLGSSLKPHPAREGWQDSSNVHGRGNRRGGCTCAITHPGARQSRLRPGGNRARLKERIQQLRLDTSHFVGMAWRRGITIPPVPRKPLAELLHEGRLQKTDRLKKRLIEEGLKMRRCEMCLRDHWNGKPIPIELDHLNGRRDDNRLQNLRILCPNCHAQTPTYRGRNIGAAVHV